MSGDRRPATAAAVWTLVVLTVLNFLNYVDRYVLAAVLDTMKKDPIFAPHSDAQLGLFGTSFMVVYMLAAPAAGLLGRRVPRKYLVAVGVGIWSAATIASGLVRSYPEMLVARAFIGFGEAGYATVAPAILSDLFQRRARGRILSIFYLATPVGSALGFILGGVVAERAGWRAAFFAAGGPGLLFALLALFTPEPARGASDEPKAVRRTLGEGLRLLLGREFIAITAGTTLMTFSVGGLAYWMPTYLQQVRHMSRVTANVAFGGIAVAAGILGTFAGGFLGDAWQRRRPGAYLLLSAIGLVIAAPLAALTPFVASLTFAFALLFFAELGIFLNTGPLNTALVNAAPPEVRELALGLNILCIHLFGDAISPPLLGLASDALKRRGLTPDLAASLAIAVTALPLLVGGWVLYRQSRAPPG